MTEPTPVDLESLRAGTIATIVPELPSLDDAQIASLLAAEQAAERPRSTLIEAIELDMTHRADAAQDNGDAAQASADDAEDARLAAKAERETAVAAAAGPKPAWQAPDYAGPLDGAQASWRNAHLKRFDPDAVAPPPEPQTVTVTVNVSPGKSGATAGQIAKSVAAKLAADSKDQGPDA